MTSTNKVSLLLLAFTFFIGTVKGINKGQEDNKENG